MSDVARLYRSFAPTHYDLHFTLDAKNLTFAGKATIYGDKKNSLPTLQLHAKDLQIDSVNINDISCEYKVTDDVINISHTTTEADTITIEITYHGIITKAMHGIYPAYPSDGSVMLGTQFESHHAREAFPCIDEPEAKATYDITITSHEPVILSNMPAKHVTTNKEGSKTVIFERTPIMSSYLVAFVTGDLQSVSTATEDGTEIRVWSSKDHDIESLVFPLEVAVKTTEFFNDYFGVKYPLPKCDHVALPDFSSGAMENWGLITYREVALITDPNTISTSAKEYIATVIAHEISHQWFGNLVTMQWWDDLWLNESFATLMEYLVIDAIYPDWNVMLSFAAHEALSAFRRDVLPGVQSVATPVRHPDEISTLFDPSIVYAKGARLLYMAYYLVGDRNFKKGLQRYFKTHAYGNTTGEDLWYALSKSSNIDVASVMHPWIMQSGFPYVKVSPVNDKTIHIEQHQLWTEKGASNKLWPIPLWQSGTSKLEILDAKDMELTVENTHAQLNTVGGHYVPYYTSDATKKDIYTRVQKQELTPDHRLLLLHDPLLLARCGVASFTDTLKTLTYYNAEAEESVWSVISLVIGDTRMMIEGNEDAESALKSFTYMLVKRQFKRLGFITQKDDTSNDKKLRSIIAGLAVYSEHPDVIKQALAIYDNTASIDQLPADSRASLMTAAIKHGKQSVFDDFLTLYPTITNGDIQMDVAGAMCASKDVSNLKVLLLKLKDQSFVRLQDMDRFLIYLLRNQKSREFAWHWLTTNWNWITDVFAQDKSYDNYPRYAGSVFSTEAWLDKFNAHFAPLRNVNSLARNIDLGTKDIVSKIEWRKRDEKLVSDWLLLHR